MKNEHGIIESLCQTYGTPIEKAFLKAVTHYYELHRNELFTLRAATKAAVISDYITQTDMDLLKDARATNIYLGYVLNRESGNIDEVAFAYPNTNGVIAWTINVEEQTSQKTLDLDIVPFRKERTASKTSRFTPKTAKRKVNLE